MNVLVELVKVDNFIIPAVILLSSVVEGVYFMKMLVKMWYSKHDVKEIKFDVVTKYVVVLIALLLTVFGVYFEPLRDLMSTIVSLTVGGIV